MFSLSSRPPSKSVILKNDLLLVFKNNVLFWIRKASANMTARFSVKNSHIDDDLIFGIKKTDTYSQGYYCQPKMIVFYNSFLCFQNRVRRFCTRTGRARVVRAQVMEERKEKGREEGLNERTIE